MEDPKNNRTSESRRASEPEGSRQSALVEDRSSDLEPAEGRSSAPAEGRPSEPAGGKPFLVAVITRPDFFPGEAACLEALLGAGLEKLHLRKPGVREEELEGLLKQIDSRWYSRIVLHGDEQLRLLAARYGIPQMHCPPGALKELKQRCVKTEIRRREGPANRSGEEPAVSQQVWPREECPIAHSASLHSWEEIKEIEGAGLTYVFMSPVFDSISKPGYTAAQGLLRRPASPYPCKVIGLGGVDKDTIGELIREGWDGAAVLGWIWEETGMAVKRFEQLIAAIKNNLV